MILLDQDGLGQILAVIAASTNAHRVFFQHAQSGRSLSGVENLRYFASLYRGRECVSPEDALRSVGLDPALARPVGLYSQGMKQRASLARVLVSRPELLLLDEPFSNMDIGSAHQMLRLLETFRSEQRTIVLTTHQRELAEPLADFVLTLQAGSVASLEDGPYAQRGSLTLAGGVER